MKLLMALGSLLLLPTAVQAQVVPEGALLYVDFALAPRNAGSGGEFVLHHGLQRDEQGRLEFTTARQIAELDEEGTASVSQGLQDIDSLTVGGWFLLRRTGEQVLIGRDEVVIGALGERFFRPNDRFINFALGTDERGFLMGTINGNGRMPFLHVTVNSVPILQWQQLAVTKDSEGHHRFYQNGVLVHSDHRALSAPSRQPWRETEQGRTEPIRLQMPTGGLVGEIWIVGRALSPEEIAADYEHKKHRYRPAPPGRAVAVREMFSRPPAEPPEFDRAQIDAEMRKLLGPLPEERVPLEPQVHSEDDCGTYIRRKISIQVQPGDRMPAYLLIPKRRPGPVPAIICFYGTTGGTGKRTTVGLSGLRPGEPAHPNLSFAIDVVEAGFVAFAPDYLRDGERVHPGDVPYDTTRFYEQFPDWSVHGKDVWDTMRAIDYLQSLPFVDGERIGMMGHSYGGHSTIFAAALEPRIRAAVANGPVSAFREHGMHWAVPRGARNSQSLPALRPYLLSPDKPLPVSFAELTALIAPRPLLVGQAAGERRPIEEENYGFVKRVYRSADPGEKVRYIWYAGDHDFPPAARAEAVRWFRRWLGAVQGS